MNDRERKYSDIIDVMLDLIDNAPTSASILRLSKLMGEVHEAMRLEKAEPATEEPVQ
jgi:hypothetical protein